MGFLHSFVDWFATLTRSDWITIVTSIGIGLGLFWVERRRRLRETKDNLWSAARQVFDEWNAAVDAISDIIKNIYPVLPKEHENHSFSIETMVWTKKSLISTIRRFHIEKSYEHFVGVLDRQQMYQ